jgi:hypothetical protein
MTIKYFVYSIPVITMLFLSLDVNAYAGTIRIEGTIEKPDKISGSYDFPKDGIFGISNSANLAI